jgi:hypothetical protein
VDLLTDMRPACPFPVRSDTDVYAATAAKLAQEQLAPKVTAKYN